jgi:hypothetical protein
MSWDDDEPRAGQDLSEIDFEIPVPECGTIWRVRGDEAGVMHLEMRQRPVDVFGILDANGEAQAKDIRRRDIQPFARVPLVVLQDWQNLGIRYHDANDAKEVMKRLASNDAYRLRTSQYKG